MKVPPLLIIVVLAAIALAASAKAPPAQHAEPDAYELRMTPETAAKCDAEGGCGVVSRKYIELLLEQARAEGCRNRKKET